MKKILLMPIAITIISFSLLTNCSNSTQSTKIEMPTEGLLLYYPFNGDAKNDISAIADGQNFGAQLTQDRFKNDSSAYYFNGFDSYIDIGNEDITKPGFPVTISVWIKKTDNEQGWIFSNNLNQNYYKGIFMGFGDGNLISLHFGNGNLIGTPAARRSIYAIDPIELSKWYHIIGIIESADNMKLYINGVEISTVYSGSASKLVYDNGIACFGKFHNWQNQNARYFKGMIDDFRIYDRVLNDEEIENLYKEANYK
ncbi:MAG: LamG domain-containing protein [Melioribacteraceae bacterium]|nr:LamG domain-containing protein [Melioribacteraceae bacterium]